jgi:hypothetical protein
MQHVTGDCNVEMQLSMTLASFGTPMPETCTGMQRGPKDIDIDLPLAIMGAGATATKQGSTEFKDDITTYCPKSDEDDDDDDDDVATEHRPATGQNELGEGRRDYQYPGSSAEEGAAEDVTDDPAALGKENRRTKSRWARKSHRLCKVKRERLDKLAKRLVAMENVELSAELQANQFFMNKLMNKVAQISHAASKAAVSLPSNIDVPTVSPMQQYGSHYASSISYDAHGMAAGSVAAHAAASHAAAAHAAATWTRAMSERTALEQIWQ